MLISAALVSPLAAQDRMDSEAAWDSPVADAQFRGRDYPKADVVRVQLPALDAKSIDALRRSNAERGRAPLKLGLHRPASLADRALSAADLRWHVAADGSRSARFAVSAAGAAALRLGLRIEGLPAEAELRFGSEPGRGGDAPMLGAAQWAEMAKVDSTVWTPLTHGDTQWVEIHVPAQADLRWLSLSLDRVSHLLVDPSRPYDQAKINESEQPCMLDAKCVTDPSAAFTSAKNAVASMVFEADGSSAVCTGTLLVDTDTSTQVPNFFSAAHCFTTQAVANTLTTLWFYEATACGSRVEDASTRQVAGGGQVLFADVPSDVLLLRLNGTPPAGSTFLGWDSAAISVGTDFTVIHHPAGDAKKVSQGRVTGLGPSTLASGQFIQVAYTVAATEGGSSGSGLLTAGDNGFVLRGGLLGGSSDCSNSNTDSEGNSDDYSRFDLVFPSIRSFLQPSSTTPPSTTDYTGAWNNSSQDGWGVVVIRGTSGAYGMYIYHYDQDGTPAWYLSFGGLTGSTFDADLFAFRGPWFGVSPFNPGQVVPRTAGTLSMAFSSPTAAIVTFTIDGRSVQTTLNKLAF